MLGWVTLGMTYTNVTDTRLTTKEIKELFDYKDGNLYWKKASSKRIKIGKKIGNQHPKNKYIQFVYKGKLYMLHRLIWLWHENELIDGLEIDHIDRGDTSYQKEKELLANEVWKPYHEAIDLYKKDIKNVYYNPFV